MWFQILCKSCCPSLVSSFHWPSSLVRCFAPSYLLLADLLSNRIRAFLELLCHSPSARCVSILLRYFYVAGPDLCPLRKEPAATFVGILVGIFVWLWQSQLLVEFLPLKQIFIFFFTELGNSGIRIMFVFLMAFLKNRMSFKTSY